MVPASKESQSLAGGLGHPRSAPRHPPTQDSNQTASKASTASLKTPSTRQSPHRDHDEGLSSLLRTPIRRWSAQGGDGDGAVVCSGRPDMIRSKACTMAWSTPGRTGMSTASGACRRRSADGSVAGRAFGFGLQSADRTKERHLPATKVRSTSVDESALQLASQRLGWRGLSVRLVGRVITAGASDPTSRRAAATGWRPPLPPPASRCR